MKKLFIFMLKPLSFLPALVMMYIIFNFSAQSGDISGNLSHQVSVKIVEIGNEVLQKDLDEAGILEVADRIEYPVRKAAHMTEYFFLAVAVSFPLYVYGLRGFPLMLVAGIICVGFACGDEYHQSFVDGRGPSIKDVGIDSIGVFFGIITVRIVCFAFLAPARMYERAKDRRIRKQLREERAYAHGRRSRRRPRNYFEDFEEDDYYYNQALEEERERQYAEEYEDDYEDEYDYDDEDDAYATADLGATKIIQTGMPKRQPPRPAPSKRPTGDVRISIDDLEQELAEDVRKYMN